MDTQLIDTVYDTLIRARVSYAEAVEEAITARYILSTARMLALADGSLTGKNEEAREAAARTMFPTLFEAVENKERAERSAKLRLEMAADQVARVRLTLRAAEYAEKVEELALLRDAGVTGRDGDA